MSPIGKRQWPGGPRVKNLPLVASGPSIRRIPFGPGRGINFRIDFDWGLGKRMYLGLYEIEVARYLKGFTSPGETCFDVGAHWGYDALIMAKRTRARVRAFEADAANALLMREVLESNPDLAPFIDIREEFVTAEVSPETSRTSLDHHAFGPDGLVPDFVKMDIEGGELDALEGSSRLLSQARPNLLVEIHSEELEEQCGDLLRGHGYSPIKIAHRRVLSGHRPGYNSWLVASSR